MKDFVSKILSNDILEARSVLEDEIINLIDEKLNQIKLRLVSEMYKTVGVDVDFVTENNSKTVTNYGKTRLIRVRIRKGKIQRRKKFSNLKGYTIRGAADPKVVRMSPLEHRHRIVSARRASFKRLTKLSQTLVKRQRSLRKRKAMGL
jgi:hypothetical protein